MGLEVVISGDLVVGACFALVVVAQDASGHGSFLPLQEESRFILHLNTTVILRSCL
jgi:hypothetical protein